MNEQAIDLPPVVEWRRLEAQEHAYTERQVIRLERVARGTMTADTRRGESSFRRLARWFLG